MSKHIITFEITDEDITSIVKDLNDEFDRTDPYRYSDSQVEDALREMVANGAEDIVERFWELWQGERERLLGDPAVNVKQEAAFARADYEYDVRRDG